MRVVVAGANGQLGSDCVDVLSTEHQVLPMDLPEFDIGDPAAVKAIDECRPDCIVNCAAYTMVDDCEDNRDLAFRVNVTGARNLAVGARKRGARIIHISTDYVFDGKKPYPMAYTESDPIGPLSYYGVTKAESEKVVRESTDRYFILRTAWMYGIKGRNFPKTMLRLAVADPGRVLKVVGDQFGSPTWSFRLAEQIRHLIGMEGQGVFHATAEGHCSWHEFAEAFLRGMGVTLRPVPCSSREYPTRAVRPGNSILENAALKERGWDRMRPWNEDLEEFISLYRDRLLREAEGE